MEEEDNGPVFPHDLEIEILKRLPVKSLMRFRCVSKSWDHRIQSPRFAEGHLRQKGKNGQMLLMRRCVKQKRGKSYDDVLSFHKLDTMKQVGRSIPIPFLESMDTLWAISNPATEFHVLGPSNGLVCIVAGNRVILCNPALREFRCLLPCPFDIKKLLIDSVSGMGFGFDSTTNDYKIVLFRNIFSVSNIPGDKREEVFVYTTSTNSWREIDCYGIILDRDVFTEVLFNDCCHFLARAVEDFESKMVLSFDIKTEVIKQIEYPIDCELNSSTRVNLKVLHGCLAMLRYEKGHKQSYDVDIWVMKEYGVSSSWSKVKVIQANYFIYPLCWIGDDLLVEEMARGKVVSINLHTNKIRDVRVHGKPFTFRALIYQESLLKLDQIIKSS